MYLQTQRNPSQNSMLAPNVDEVVQQLVSTYTYCQWEWKISITSLKNCLWHNNSMPKNLLKINENICPQKNNKNLYINVKSSFTHNSQNSEKIQVSINRRMINNLWEIYLLEY